MTVQPACIVVFNVCQRFDKLILYFLSYRDRQQRPEFLAKQHQLKSSALKKQEHKDNQENNELFAKLKSRSEVIDQV
jgi:hypothetical protein